MILLVLIAAALVAPGARADADYDFDEDEDDDAVAKSYDRYMAQDLTTQPLWGARGAARGARGAGDTALGPRELQDVRGALQQLLAGQNVDGLIQPKPTTTTADEEADAGSARHATKVIARMYRTLKSTTDEDNLDSFFGVHNRPSTASSPDTGTADLLRSFVETEEEYAVKIITPTRSAQPIADTDLETTEGDYAYKVMLRTLADGDVKGLLRAGPINKNVPIPTSAATCRTATRLLDVVALLNIIANLTYDYETNLTSWVNDTLWRWSIPTCPTPTTTTTTTTGVITTTFPGYDYDANGTGTIMGKCYVCGLEVEEIPYRAYCADAFAGDFLPLVPVDPTARGQIGNYRKYCRYLDVPNFHINQSDPRSMWGRWTGGCAVRWIDLSGVYTQRTCRNRFKAVLGKHFVSKRMAKLEMALQWVDNGCIISPAASLVPLSRGISLYARFHACVCTGSWCNRARRARRAAAPALALALALLYAH